jgi:hypothetical protein
MEYYITYISFRPLSYIIDAGMRAWPGVYRISVWQQEGRLTVVTAVAANKGRAYSAASIV